MPTVRISVTDLDQYLYWMQLEDEGPEWLINRLTTFEPSDAMDAGSAFHNALEHVTSSGSLLTGRVSGRNYEFNFICDAQLSLPSQRELKIEREILPGVVLVGKVDAVDGNRIIDYKLTAKLDAERYIDSMQWRAYLMLFEVSEFQYSIFQGSPNRGNWLAYTIDEQHVLNLYSYPGMDSDVERCASDLAKFILHYNIAAKMQSDAPAVKTITQ